MVAGRLSSVSTWSVECVVLTPDPLVQACQSFVVCFLRSIDDRSRGLVDVVSLVMSMVFLVVSSTPSSVFLDVI